MGGTERVDADAPDLPCGASYDALVTQVAERRAPGAATAAHQRTCAHCRAALAEMDDLWAPVHALADQRVRAPAGLMGAVMARVRELPRHRDWALVPQEGDQAGLGTTRVAARVVGALARTAALQVPGVVRALGGGRAAQDGPGTSVGVAGSHLVLQVSLVVARGESVPALADRVRQQVSSLVHGLTGLVVAQVDVHVADAV